MVRRTIFQFLPVLRTPEFFASKRTSKIFRIIHPDGRVSATPWSDQQILHHVVTKVISNLPGGLTKDELNERDRLLFEVLRLLQKASSKLSLAQQSGELTIINERLVGAERRPQDEQARRTSWDLISLARDILNNAYLIESNEILNSRRNKGDNAAKVAFDMLNVLFLA